MRIPAASSQEEPFTPRLSVEQVEEGMTLAPKFDANGLIPVVTTDATSGEVLMMGVMTAETLLRTMETGEAHYWSRSRKCIWRKGATSGLVQKIVEIRIDDDQDAVWLRVDIIGGASCHVGYRSCFYRAVPLRSGTRPISLTYTEAAKAFDPLEVYGAAPSPTQL